MMTLLWFQRDLRIRQNPSLEWAISQNQPIVAVYIHSPEEDSPWSEGTASRWWLHHSLEKLSIDLLKINIRLHYFKANSVDTFKQLLKENNFSSIVWTNRIEPKRKACEAEIEQVAISYGAEVKRFSSELLAKPDEFLTTSKKTPYRVFTPFYKKFRNQLRIEYSSKPNETHKSVSEAVIHKIFDNESSLDGLKLLDTHSWHKKLHQYWTPGEDSAIHQLEYFIAHDLANYSKNRDYPSIDGTSRLSPHLHFGEISPHQVLQQILPLIENVEGKTTTEAESYLRQLIWREFARYILWHFPQSTETSMNSNFNNSFWSNNLNHLKKWQEGKTGIDIVDAGMRQLWETGNMHNRVRMLAASLLTKNMDICWQQGAKWFWDTLVDADLANNSMGWQWVAGCGVDAAPYFRIFNPVTQAHKFDHNNTYVNKWLIQRSANDESIIDLTSSRKLALERYHSIIKSTHKEG